MALTTILYEQTLELMAGSLSYVEAEMPLVIGEPYIVHWDGVEYECVAIEMTMNGAVLPYLGNPLIAVGGEDNGLPFVVGYAPAEVTGSSEMFGIATNSEGTHTVAVYTKAIFPVWPLSGFAFNDYYGAYMVSIPDTPFTIPVIGETCVVKWDGVAYTCVAQDASTMGEGAIGLGNATALGGSGNNEPFVIGWMAGDMAIIAFDTETTHTVGIYPEDTAEEEPGEEPEEEEGIVLKDRNGNDITYQGIKMIKLKTTSGGTKTFAACDEVAKTVSPDFSAGDMEVLPDEGTLLASVTIEKPETLKPENVRSGVKVAGVTGEFVGDTEEATVELALADGNQVVSPSADGKVISKVTIVKPETLVPGNIAKDVDIGGVIGTMEAGGGSSLCVFARTTYKIQRGYLSSAQSVSCEITQTLPLGSKVVNVTSSNHSASSTNASTLQTSGPFVAQPNGSATITEAATSVQVKTNQSSTFSKSYFAYDCVQTVFYTVPGLYMRIDADGNAILYADTDAKVWQAYQIPVIAPQKIDLSQSSITSLSACAMRNSPGLKEIVLPAGLTSLGSMTLDTATLEVIDASHCTAIPSIATNSIPKNTGLQILVPAALYDSWITATNWSSYASYIVAV